MAKATEFPAFLKIIYDESDASNRFARDIKSLTQSAEQTFNSSFNRISSVIDAAISPAKFKELGKIDVGVDSFKDAAAQARVYQEAISATLRTATALATETGDISSKTQQYIRSLEAHNKGARDAVAAADAQVATYTRLQTALDITAAKSSRLAAAQRELYATEAAAARVEVSQRSSQEKFTSFAAPNIGRSAVDNGATFAALEQRAALDDLRRAEAGAAEGARLLTAIQQNTGLALDRTAKSARDSAQAFLAAEAAQKQLAGEASELRAALDPMFAAQQRFDDELVRAERLYQQGAITAREYAQAQQLARTNLRGASDAIHQQSEAFVGSQKALGSQRFAMIQVGQQLQDMTVGFASGQRAATIFAQQLPQLGFALTGFQGKVGKLGEFLAGPYGFAIFATVTAASYALSAAFGETEESSKKLTGALDFQKLSMDELVKATREQADEAEKSLKSSYAQEEAALRVANANLEQARAKREAIKADLEAAKLGAEDALNFNTSSNSTEAVQKIAAANDLVRSYETRLAKQQEAINNIDRERRAKEVPIINRQVEAKNDPSAAATERYTKAVDKLTDAFVKNKISRDILIGAKDSLLKKYNAETKAIKEAEQATRSAGKAQYETTRFDSPIAGRRSSSFGNRSDPITGEKKFHAGVDIAAPNGTPVRAPADGVVIETGTLGGYGKVVFIDHGAGTISRLAHLSNNSQVVEGQKVSRGDIVGNVGSTGRSTGNHLHFEVRRGGKAVNPNGSFPIDEAAASQKAQQAAERAAEAAARETSRLSALSDQAAESILRINEQYDEQPRLIDRAAQSTRKLDGIISELNDPKNAGTPRLEELIKEAQQARALASNAVNDEIQRYIEDNETNLEILRLQAAGLDDQAQILAEINQLDERLGLSSALEKLREQEALAKSILTNEQSTQADREAALTTITNTNQKMAEISAQQEQLKKAAKERLEEERKLNELTERRREEVGHYLRALDSVRGTLTSILSGQKTDILGDFKKTFKELRGNLLFDQLFGDAFKQIEQQLNRNTPLGKANAQLVEEVDQTSRVANEASQAFAEVGNAAIAAAKALNGVSGVQSPNFAANDNKIATKDTPQKFEIENRSISAFADALAQSIVGPLEAVLKPLFGTKFTQQLSAVFASAVSGYAQGGTTGGVLGALRGGTFEFGPDIFGKGASDSLLKGLDGAIGGAGTGTQINSIANALGLGDKFSGTGAQVGGAIGSVSGIPGGDIIGSVLGGVLGKVFGGSKRGSAIITGADTALTTYGNSGSRKEAALGLGASVQDSIRNIAKTLDADLNAFKVSIGIRNKSFRVDTQGRGYTKGSKAGVHDFGDDEAAAIAFAIKDAINDGAISGIRQSTQNLLRAGDDLEKALADAVDFENVFKRLRSYKDPVGAAIDALDKEFNNLKDMFDRAGASAQEYADLEELYGIERAQAVKEAAERITGSLKNLFNDLTIGDSGLSLRTRLANAQSEYNPLAAKVAAGDVTAYDDYADSARTLLDLQREIYGSSEDYFRLLDEVTKLTKSRIDAESNIASISENKNTPFSIDQTPVVDAINNQTASLASYLAAILKNGSVPIVVNGGGGGKEPINRNVANF